MKEEDMQAERIIPILLTIFSAFFLVMSLQIENRSSTFIAPGTWPAVLMLLMLILSIVDLIRSFRKSNTTVKEEVEDDEDSLIYPAKFFILIGALAIYTFILGYAGFVVSTLLIIFILTLLFGMKNWLNRLATSVASTAAFIIIFPILLSTPFPRGVGIFRTISSLFY